MEIVDLKPRQGNVEIVGDIIDKGEIREFQKFGKPGRVCTAKLKDGSGEISLTLWNDDIEKVNVGDKVKIENGYVNEWQGEMQLTTGKFGKLEIVEQGKGSDEKTEQPAEKDPVEEPKDISAEEEEVK